VRRLDPQGSTQDFVQISTTTSDPFDVNVNYDANVTPLPDGGFYVTYKAGPGSPQPRGSLLGQRYGANGQPVGSLTTLVDNSVSPRGGGTLTTLADGDLLVAWSVDRSGANDDSYFQVFSPDGAARGPRQAVVNDLDSQSVLAVAPDAGNGFVLAWGDDTQRDTIYAQRWVDT